MNREWQTTETFHIYIIADMGKRMQDYIGTEFQHNLIYHSIQSFAVIDNPDESAGYIVIVVFNLREREGNE